ncbi:uncharacterized protein TRAVEDRAFT_43171 [Trametes versicolor FP-101664 SS1]|uniref:uncharacterized protein n=1 Tax=Trametes versicolor (strain FP-101664) TaxID=717944 RepID=UPI0004622BAA|nr:uncharacterized protein TRAVEDRAFT_43171 [Trametes versicolor FP-101664 SS1]EIW62849.1 hypothetical protein TRAVEDRAFT_43171 [Trametes versicolor FP-101664 SS1]
MHAGDVSSLRPFSREMKALNADMVAEDVVARDRLKHLLNEPLPHLEQLRIETIPAGSEDNFFRIYQPFTYSLRAANLPRLHSLIAVGTRVDLDRPLCGNIRHLHMQLSNNTYQKPSLPLNNFLQLVRNCSRLETLCVDHYIDVSTPAGTPSPPPVLSLTGHTQLKAISFRDQPHIVSRIISFLVIPAHITTHISTFVTGNKPTAALRAMIPDDPAKLLLLGRANKVEVRHTAQYPALRAGMLGDAHGHFEMELLPAHNPRDLGVVGGFPDGVVLHAMMQSLGIFNTCPARLLRVQGNLQHVTLESWLAAFDRFPDLEQLEIEDTQDFSMDAIDVALRALSSRSRTRSGGAPCPQLKRLRVQGKIRNQYGRLPPVIILFLERINLRAPRLHRLELDLYADRAWEAGVAVNLQRLFVPLAVQVELHIREPSNRQ